MTLLVGGGEEDEQPGNVLSVSHSVLSCYQHIRSYGSQTVLSASSEMFCEQMLPCLSYHVSSYITWMV